MRFTIPDQYHDCPLAISTLAAFTDVNVGTVPGAVLVQQRAGSMTLHHSLTPEQARDMARALIACAEALEPTEVPA